MKTIIYIAGISVINLWLAVSPSAAQIPPSATPPPPLSKVLPAAERGVVMAQKDAGLLYARGDGGAPKDMERALYWWRKAAEQGEKCSQYFLGNAYANGDSVPLDMSQAIKWWRKAADLGLSSAQYNLGIAYSKGDGVSRDLAQAKAWLRKAVDGGHPQASMTLAQLEGRASQPGAIPPGTQGKRVGTGSGCFVSEDGLILTAAHVVGDNREQAMNAAITVSTQEQKNISAKVLKYDGPNDLAVLRCDGRFPTLTVVNSNGVIQRQKVIACGFPLSDKVGYEPSITTGIVSKLSGPKDNSTLFQITAAIQPGNSGGPLLDENGDVIGVVVGTLLPYEDRDGRMVNAQDMHYAVKSNIVAGMLKDFGVELGDLKKADANSADIEEVNKRINKSLVFIKVER